MFLRVAIANHVVMIIMQFLERALPWSREQLKDMPDFDPQMVAIGRGVLFPSPPGVIDRV